MLSLNFKLILFSSARRIVIMYFEPVKKTYYRFPSTNNAHDLDTRYYFPEKSSHTDVDTRSVAPFSNRSLDRETYTEH